MTKSAADYELVDQSTSQTDISSTRSSTPSLPQNEAIKVNEAITVVDQDSLRESHRNDDLSTQLARDMGKWEETLKEGQQDPAKIAALKKTFLLFGSSGMNVAGASVEGGAESISASENKLPIAEYISGHMGRVYAGLPAGKGGETLDWISGKEEGNNVVKPRFAATHAGKVSEDGVIHEKKLSLFQSFTSGLSSMLSSAFGSSTPRIHNGMDVAIGGNGKKYESATNDPSDHGVIRDDGTGGHVYYNVNTGKHGDSLGCGLEGTAPAKTGYLGAHSFIGAADEFTALEGDKFALKFSTKNLSSYLKNNKEMEGADPEAVQKLQDHVAYEKKSWFGKLFSKEKGLSKSELTEECEKVGIVFADKGKQMLTRFGKQCLDSGIKPQDNYNGATMNISEETLSAAKATDISKIPNEVIYFKPQTSVDCFTAQEPIYTNIASKPALRNNPQFSHETSVAVGTFYNAAQDPACSSEKKEIIEQTVGLIDKGRLATLGIDINKFDVRKDADQLKEALGSASSETLKGLGITNREAVQESLGTMQQVANKAQTRFDSPDKYVDLQQGVVNSVSNNSSKNNPELVVENVKNNKVEVAASVTAPAKQTTVDQTLNGVEHSSEVHDIMSKLSKAGVKDESNKSQNHVAPNLAANTKSKDTGMVAGG